MHVEAQVTSRYFRKLRVLAWGWSAGNVPYDLPRLSIKFGRGPRGIADYVGKNDYSADKPDMNGSRSLVAINNRKKKASNCTIPKGCADNPFDRSRHGPPNTLDLLVPQNPHLHRKKSCQDQMCRSWASKSRSSRLYAGECM